MLNWMRGIFSLFSGVNNWKIERSQSRRPRNLASQSFISNLGHFRNSETPVDPALDQDGVYAHLKSLGYDTSMFNLRVCETGVFQHYKLYRLFVNADEDGKQSVTAFLYTPSRRIPAKHRLIILDGSSAPLYLALYVEKTRIHTGNIVQYIKLFGQFVVAPDGENKLWPFIFFTSEEEADKLGISTLEEHRGSVEAYMRVIREGINNSGVPCGKSSDGELPVFKDKGFFTVSLMCAYQDHVFIARMKVHCRGRIEMMSDMGLEREQETSPDERVRILTTMEPINFALPEKNDYAPLRPLTSRRWAQILRAVWYAAILGIFGLAAYGLWSDGSIVPQAVLTDSRLVTMVFYVSALVYAGLMLRALLRVDYILYPLLRLFPTDLWVFHEHKQDRKDKLALDTEQAVARGASWRLFWVRRRPLRYALWLLLLMIVPFVALMSAWYVMDPDIIATDRPLDLSTVTAVEFPLLAFDLVLRIVYDFFEITGISLADIQHARTDGLVILAVFLANFYATELVLSLFFQDMNDVDRRTDDEFGSAKQDALEPTGDTRITVRQK